MAEQPYAFRMAYVWRGLLNDELISAQLANSRRTALLDPLFKLHALGRYRGSSLSMVWAHNHDGDSRRHETYRSVGKSSTPGHDLRRWAAEGSLLDQHSPRARQSNWPNYNHRRTWFLTISRGVRVLRIS